MGVRIPNDSLEPGAIPRRALLQEAHVRVQMLLLRAGLVQPLALVLEIAGFVPIRSSVFVQPVVFFRRHTGLRDRSLRDPSFRTFQRLEGSLGGKNDKYQDSPLAAHSR